LKVDFIVRAIAVTSNSWAVASLYYLCYFHLAFLCCGDSKSSSI